MDEINISEHIYGEETPIIQGTMGRKKPKVDSKIEKYFTSSNIRETQKPTSINGHFLHDGLIL